MEKTDWPGIFRGLLCGLVVGFLIVTFVRGSRK